MHLVTDETGKNYIRHHDIRLYRTFASNYEEILEIDSQC